MQDLSLEDNYEKVSLGDYIEAVALSPYTKNNRSNSWFGYSKQINPKIDLELIISEKGDAQVGLFTKFRVIHINNLKNKVIAINSLNFCSKPIDTSFIGIIDKFIIRINDGFEEYGKAQSLIILGQIVRAYRECLTMNATHRFEYYYGMNRPTFKEANLIKNLLLNIKNELKKKELCDYTEIEKHIDLLLKTNVMTHLMSLKKYLSNDDKKLLELKFGKKEKKQILDKVTIKRLLSEQEKEKMQWANSTHEKTLQILIKKLKNLNYTPEEGIFIDCYANIKNKPAIFEVKSLTSNNELSQIRAAISQLYEYSYRHDCPEASLWLVLSQKPQIEWILDYLINARKINVLWIENEILVGPSLKLL